MALSLILESCPDWFGISDAKDDEILGRTTIEVEGAADRITADLRIHRVADMIAVQEQVPGTRYPKTCHERHLQSDENFCLGMRAGDDIVSRDHAIVWWGLLKHFLELQRVAQRTKRWPPKQQMSHGAAGPHHIAAATAARELGTEDAYMRMLEGEDTWFSVGAFKVTRTGKLANGWLPCPVGCKRNGKSIARAECCNPTAVTTLLNEERLRRREVAEFYTLSHALGEVCCGTMLSCPLRDLAAARSTICTAAA